LFLKNSLYSKIKKVLVALILIIILLYSNYDQLQAIISSDFISRIYRLFQYGLMEDHSFAYRIQELWFPPIDYVNTYFYGTVSNPTKQFEVIDSGYITYYAQGGWFFLVFLVSNFIYFIYKSLRFSSETTVCPDFYVGRFCFFFIFYLVIAMIISNPMRNMVIIFVYVSLIVILGKRTHNSK